MSIRETMHFILNIIFCLVVPLSTVELASAPELSQTNKTLPHCSVNHVTYTQAEERMGCYTDPFYYDYLHEYHVAPICTKSVKGGWDVYLYHLKIIQNSTIVCTDLSATQDIDHQYTEERYQQFLKINRSSISTLPPQAFISFTTITKLYLSQINIKSIKPGAFNGLLKLRELHLDNNDLTEVSNGVFNSLHRLEILNLTSNKIIYIDKHAFMGMANLEMLYLKNNQLAKIENSSFENQQHLEYLDLSGNPLEVLSLDGLTNLDTLLLTGSALSDFEEDLSNFTMTFLDLSSGNFSLIDFSYFPRVNNLDLSRNRITAIDNCGKLDSVVVNLNNNDISTINGTFSGILEIYLGHNKLKTLGSTLLNKSEDLLIADFSFNKISSIDKNVFQGLHSLEKLFLQNNEIVKIDLGLFHGLTNLTVLNLSHNRIAEFQYGTFDSLTMLEVLDISDNRLVDLHQYTLHSLSNLLDLHFGNNRITSFDVRDLSSHLKNLRFVSLTGNPWKCEELVKISQAFKSFKLSLSDGSDYKVENFHGIPCLGQKVVLKSTNVSGFSDEKSSENSQKVVDEGVKNSKMNLKLVQQNENDSKLGKFASFQTAPNESNNVPPLQIVGVILLFALLLSMIFMVYLQMSLLKKIGIKREPNRLSQMDLVL